MLQKPKPCNIKKSSTIYIGLGVNSAISKAVVNRLQVRTEKEVIFGAKVSSFAVVDGENFGPEKKIISEAKIFLAAAAATTG